MRLNILLALLLFYNAAYSSVVIKNVNFKYTGVQLIVNYDLESARADDLFIVGIEVFSVKTVDYIVEHQIGHKTHKTHHSESKATRLDAISFSGEVGQSIKPGINKIVYWNTKADNINFSGKIFFKVIVKPRSNIAITNHVIKSIIYPGLGSYRLDNSSWHFLYGIGAYGAAFGSVLLNQKAVESYANYKSSFNAVQANSYYNQANTQLTNSYVLAGSALAICGYSVYRTYVKAQKIKSEPIITQSSSKYYYQKTSNEFTSFSDTQNVEIKGIYYPPNLSFRSSLLNKQDVQLLDNNNNELTYLNATESAKLVFEIGNNGLGNASGVEVLVKETNQLTGLDFLKIYNVGNIKKNELKKVEIPITTNISLKTATANFIIDVKEANGFGIDPISIKINTKEFLKPKLEVVDFKFMSEKGGVAKRGEKIMLKVNIQNTGFGDAKSVSVNLRLPLKNVFPVNETQHQFTTIKSGEHVSVDLEFFTNKEYFDTVLAVDIQLQESWGRFAESKKVVVSLNQELSKKELNILGDVTYNSIIKPALLSSDVDINIPQNNEKKPYKYAIVIGNEDYASRQPNLQTEANVDFAEQDAKIMKEYLVKILGFEEHKVFLLINATTSEMRKELKKVEEIFERLPGGVDSEIIFYYAGHGYPDEVTKIPYLIPVDVSATDIQNGIRLSEITQRLGSVNAQKVTIILDACFTGDGRNAGLLAARTARIKPKSINLQGNMVVFSASSGDQTALPYKEKKHGYFTYFLLKKLQETKGNVTYGELFDYVTTNVQLETTIKIKPQNPQINISESVINSWKNWRMK